MRQLRKIIFINSANIPYGEVLLDGNVHFIGTQGVGKSTLLRAILFFYNANMRQLGIPSEKQSFLEYYFDNLNSHLIYEVQADKHTYCVWAFKSQNRICYRLIDKAFDKSYFIEGNQSKTEKEVQKRLNEFGISYSRNKINKYKDYTDIIYGNAKREFRKYAILESNAYENIPRTISNVFLNSKLEATFIKNTIINSITEEHHQSSIDLGSTRKSLISFLKSHKEIEQFRNNRKKGDNIIKIYHQLLKQEKLLKTKASELGSALDKAKNRIDELSQILKKEYVNKETFDAELKQIETNYFNKKRLLTSDIDYQKRQLEAAVEKSNHYQKIGIDDILSLQNRKPYFEVELNTAKTEQTILTQKHQSIEAKYRILLEQISREGDTYKTLHDRKINDLAASFNEKKAELFNKFNAQKSQWIDKEKQAIETINDKISAAKDVQSNVTTELRITRNTTFRQDEIEHIKSEINQVERLINRLEFELKSQKRAKSEFEKDTRNAIETLENRFKNQQDDLLKEIEKSETEVKQLNLHINKYDETLYGILDEEADNWRETIGKVFREDVLLRTDLKPTFEHQSNSFFGLNIDLSEVPVSAKTYEDFKFQKKRIEKLIANYQSELAKQQELLIKDRSKLQQNYNKKLRVLQKNIDKTAQQQSIENQQLKQLQIDNETLINKAKKEKNDTIDQLNKELRNAQKDVQKIEQDKRKIRADFKSKIKNLEQSHINQLNELTQNNEAKVEAATQQFNQEKANLQQKLTALNERRLDELKNQGANTKRLNEIENLIERTNNILQQIEDNVVLVAEYQKDKRELIDKQSDFEAKLKYLKAELKMLNEAFEQQKDILKNKIDTIKDLIQTYQSEQHRLKEDLDYFDKNFKISNLYQQLEEAIQQSTPIKVKSNIRDLITKLYTFDSDINGLKINLESKISNFVRDFNDDNDFNLNTRFPQKSDYITFAERLEVIFDNDLVTEKETETLKYFNQLINNIATETNALNSLKSAIETVISKINQDFRSGNFVDAVQKIELRTQPSENKIVACLLAVQKFRDENHNLGYDGLFSVLNKPTNAQKVIELLQNLSEEIKNTKLTSIHLEHSFELQFRVQENNNDTNWVNRISNVGSNGTDVLVKAMVYIMLLNVFKNKASKKVKDFTIHCIIDEVGILHDSNLKGLLQFANKRNIFLINGSPNPNDVSVYKHTYQLRKNKNRQTIIKRLITINT